jgi:SagB-type dehydrogenase family enzyme
MENGERHYCYPSAGGLYPIDCYLHIKKDRVEDMKEGLYYYDPIRRTLNLISDGKSITKDSHYFINKDIFESSAFSMYFMYNAAVSMPKYGSRAYYYAILDAGILIGYLNIISTMYEIGLCSIGDMRFSDIEQEFKLNEFQKYLHCIEFGIKE